MDFHQVSENKDNDSSAGNGDISTFSGQIVNYLEAYFRPQPYHEL